MSEFSKLAAGRHPMGYISYTLITVTSLCLSIPVSVSISVFEFVQIVLQVYRDKNLYFTLNFCTLSFLSLHLSLNLYNH